MEQQRQMMSETTAKNKALVSQIDAQTQLHYQELKMRRENITRYVPC